MAHNILQEGDSYRTDSFRPRIVSCCLQLLYNLDTDCSFDHLQHILVLHQYIQRVLIYMTDFGS